MPKLYPDQARGWIPRLLADLLVAAWTGAAIFAGVTVYKIVGGLRALTDAASETGRALNGWLDAFRQTPASGIPIVGRALDDYVGRVIDRAQAGSGTQIIQHANSAAGAITNLSVALGLITAFIPIVLISVPFVVWRLADSAKRTSMLAYVQEAAAGHRIEEAQALLAFRAVATLPLPVLARVSRDPLGDLASREHRALAAALMERNGLDSMRLGPADLSRRQAQPS
ncbi:MAG: hypothetical protein M3024_08720 [Candidatus Dormibacteraeota bacterium]|nr:hypothetical protein [Candidatus Dormibacteraeota bacterium]